ncbi:MAG: NAD(P)-dependent oxidoreductase [Lachnospiraceae bacterium]|jgi:UDP-glucuronate decarboxylase|nr:NAD(P)-dependent oxidoreductase [Lachnospiraceae bacterium]
MSRILESPGDPYLQEDLERNVTDGSLPEAELRGTTVMVTGATGLIGSALVRTLACMNRLKNTDITILALVRNAEKAEKIYGDLLMRGDINLTVCDLRRSFGAAVAESVNRMDYVIHGASVTASKTMVERPVETIATAVDGTRSLLEYAREKQVRSFVYLSSMEVYGQCPGEERVTEERMGSLDPVAVRCCYPESKRLCENLCAAYTSEYKVPTRIARLAQTFGAGVLAGENRVFAQFARSYMEGTDIVLHTEGRSEGNYCYLADTVSGILTILTKGKAGEAYNVANEELHTTIAGMASFVADKLAGGRIRVIRDIPENNPYGYAAETKLRLSSEKLRALGWKPRYGMEDCYMRMMGTMSSRTERL